MSEFIKKSVTINDNQLEIDKITLIQNISDIKSLKAVYIMYDKENTVLYVGRTKDLYSRLISHFNKAEMKEWKKDIVKVEFYPFLYTLDTYLVEIYLISILNPKHNVEFSEIIHNHTSFSFNLPEKLMLYIEWFNNSINRITQNNVCNKQNIITLENKNEYSDVFAKIFMLKKEQKYMEVAIAYQNYTGCSERTAQRHIKYAVDNNILIKENNRYFFN